MWIPYHIKGTENFQHQQQTTINTVRCAMCNGATAIIIDQDGNPKPSMKNPPNRETIEAIKVQGSEHSSRRTTRDGTTEPAAKTARANSNPPTTTRWEEAQSYEYQPTDPSYTPAISKQLESPEKDKEPTTEIRPRTKQRTPRNCGIKRNNPSTQPCTHPTAEP